MRLIKLLAPPHVTQQIATCAQLHNEAQMRVCLERVKELDDVGVVHQLLQDLNFLDYFALAFQLGVEVFLAQRLDGDEVPCKNMLR